MIVYFEEELQRQGIGVKFYTEATPEAVKAFAPDHIIWAAGGKPIVPGSIPGLDSPNVYLATDALRDCCWVGDRVVVVGGGLVGTETALDLAENGHSVTLVELLPRIMKDVAVTDFLAYSERIAKTDMRILTDTRLEEVLDNGARISGPKGEEVVEADTVILALGLKAEQGLYNELAAAGKEVYLAGDAVKAGKIFDAIHTAYRVAIRI